METVLQDCTRTARGCSGRSGTSRSSRSRHSRSPSASPPRSGASSTRPCSTRCHIPTRSNWWRCWSNRPNHSGHSISDRPSLTFEPWLPIAACSGRCCLAVDLSVDQPIAEGPEPERLSGYEVTDGDFPRYGVTPLLGRPIESEDTRDGAPPVVVLGYDYWQRRYGGNPDVVGRTIYSYGSATIVGVMPLTFDLDTPLWRPLTATGLLLQMRGTGTETDARLRSGIGRDQAQGELTDLLARQPSPASGGPAMLHCSSTTPWVGPHDRRDPCGRRHFGFAHRVRERGRPAPDGGATRSRELAIRASIGAGRGRLIRQLLTESLVLATAGGALGVLLAWASLGEPCRTFQ